VNPVLAATLDMERRGLDTLSLDYARKIRLGRMDMQLHPAGLGPGSAQFELSFRGQHVVFCGGIRLGVPLATTRASIPKCDILLLDVEPAEPKPPSVKQESTRLIKWVQDALASSSLPLVACGNLTSAIDVMWALQSLNVEIRAVRPLFEIYRRFSRSNALSWRVLRLNQTWPKQGIVIHLSRLWPHSRYFGKVVAKIVYAGPGRMSPDWAETGFRFGEGEDRSGLVSYVRRSGAKQVALGPHCDQILAKLLAKNGARIYRAQGSMQIPLPLDNPKSRP
jgi:hypothetical protein